MGYEKLFAYDRWGRIKDDVETIFGFLNIKKEVEKDFYDLIRIKIIKSTRENVRVYLRINNEILRFSTFRVGMKIVKRRQIFRRAFRSGR